jgi:uncharacterized protein
MVQHILVPLHYGLRYVFLLLTPDSRCEGVQHMSYFQPYVIKSFKHDGRLHRMWLENWRVDDLLLHPDHQQESMLVFINNQTKIQEADGKEWTSRIPGVSFFIPKQWFNVVALIEEAGIRYYCNVASPPYSLENVVTYIDYDLDVIQLPDRTVNVVDQEEYERHKLSYHYSQVVQEKVQDGLEQLLERIHRGDSPFQDDWIMRYYRLWLDREKDG